jgi:hypothetical protein
MLRLLAARYLCHLNPRYTSVLGTEPIFHFDAAKIMPVMRKPNGKNRSSVK